MSVNLKALKKFRGRVLGQGTGRPIGGVVVTLTIRTADGASVPVGACDPIRLATSRST